ncbi:MAG: ATP-dependent RNA helicase HrpA [Desulfobacterales bacterium]|nr:ATP-dependent RNA helicase HrpA [Desulfobacterales bacterium]MBF0395836.1 ATP-dependent RNA helicase HrpA [Desulfobacterales bacterium]
MLHQIKHIPNITFPENLPIISKKDEIIRSIQKHQVLIISGETGSGKSTQIPKLCLCAGRGIHGKIGCTQPRRIAAITIANRIAEELQEEIGQSVGYKIRFSDKTHRDSFIKVMTDGILLSEAQNNPYLNEYDTIIVDEAHERSLNIDFILGILKNLIKKRKNLKLIITSATIDTEKFSNAFDGAPIIKVSGRMFPVEVKYYKEKFEKSEEEDLDETTYIESAVSELDDLILESPYGGDILIFMPTEKDIHDICEIIEGRGYHNTLILPLYAKLSGEEQKRVFISQPKRKIIVATNVAETSITIPGIKYVIDTGLARISQYVPKLRVTSLPVTSISKSSADQRMGRCGRVENGVCIRLFSEEDYNNRPFFTAPEILRANLAEVILRMIALKLGDISDFPFIDKPNPKNIKDGFDLLFEIGAIKFVEDKNRYILTDKGVIMAKMPLDPRLSRILIQANDENCINEASIIVSALSIQDVRNRPDEKSKEADEMHAKFKVASSDFLTLLNIWVKYHEVWQREKTTNSLKRFCKKHFLSFKRMKEWIDVHDQIIEILQDCGMKIGNSIEIICDLDNKHPMYASIHKSILSGFLSNISVKKEKNTFLAAKGKEVMIFPGSYLFNKAGDWIVAAEIVETSKIFARTVANIDNRWIESLAKDECKYSYIEPHWDKDRGEVVAFERVVLYGLIIVSKRIVSYSRIDAEEACEIFIREALIEEDMNEILPFMRYNMMQIDAIRDMENKIRRRELLVSKENLFAFYLERLKGIYDIRTLKKRIKENGGDEFLRITKEELLLKNPDHDELSLYPDKIKLGGEKFSCKYHFNPGDKIDGVTVNIPVELKSTVFCEEIDWLIPGLLKDKIAFLVKGLPKEYRKKLLPLAKTIDFIALNIPCKRDSSLINTLSLFIYKEFGVDIPAQVWQIDNLPDYLKMRIAITDSKGMELYAARDKDVLKNNMTNELDGNEFEELKKKWERTGITSWDFENIPESLQFKKGIFIVYPFIEKDKDCVNLRLLKNKDKAISLHKEGLAALFSLHFSKDLKFLKKSLVLSFELKDKAKYFGGSKAVEKELYDSIISELFCKNIRNREEFEREAHAILPIIFDKAKEKLEEIIKVIDSYYEVKVTISSLSISNKNNKLILQFLEEISFELEKIVPQNFITLYDKSRLIHLVRYIKALEIRSKRALYNFEKDQEKANELKIYTKKLNEFVKDISSSTSDEKKKALEEYFWLIEEYKVSVFAQELKTPFPISKKRLDQKLNELDRLV